MLSVDTNLLFYAYAEDRPEHEAALEWMNALIARKDIVISEFVLLEFYNLLRNQAVLKHPLTAMAATEVIQTYRRHPYWKVLGLPANGQRLHDELWQYAATAGLARRRVFDARIALSLTHQGVRSFATANVKDFEGFGFDRVWNPLKKSRD